MGNFKIDAGIIKVSMGTSTTKTPDQKPAIYPRPEILEGKTYKIKSPLQAHALYVTINNDNGKPFEIFLTSKNVENQAWMNALALVITAIFRQGVDPSFLIHELISVHDPIGGFIRKGGGFVPSLVSEIGRCIKEHLGVKPPKMNKPYIPSLDSCPECGEYSLYQESGCVSYRSCSYSKCG